MEDYFEGGEGTTRNVEAESIDSKGEFRAGNRTLSINSESSVLVVCVLFEDFC